MKCSFWSQLFFPKKPPKQTTKQNQLTNQPLTPQKPSKNPPNKQTNKWNSSKQLLRINMQKLPFPLQSHTTTYVSASQLHKAIPSFVIKPVRKHESKWKYFRDFPLKLQTWQRITYGQLYHKRKVTVLNPAGLLHQNRMCLSSSSHWKNEAI